MKTIGELLESKGSDLWWVRPETKVFDALALMAEKNIGAVLVMCGEADLCGIFSERDYARKVILKGRSSKEMPVQEIMTPEVTCIRKEQNIRDCMELMTEKRIRHLPVREPDGRVIGIISIGDVVKEVISEQEFLIAQLENYIAGPR